MYMYVQYELQDAQDDPHNRKLRIDHVRGPVTCSPESSMENDNFQKKSPFQGVQFQLAC